METRAYIYKEYYEPTLRILEKMQYKVSGAFFSLGIPTPILTLPVAMWCFGPALVFTGHAPGCGGCTCVL